MSVIVADLPRSNGQKNNLLICEGMQRRADVQPRVQAAQAGHSWHAIHLDEVQGARLERWIALHRLVPLLLQAISSCNRLTNITQHDLFVFHRGFVNEEEFCIAHFLLNYYQPFSSKLNLSSGHINQHNISCNCSKIL